MTVVQSPMVFKYEFWDGFPTAPKHVRITKGWKMVPLPRPEERVPLRYEHQLTRCARPRLIPGRRPQDVQLYGFLGLPAANTLTNGSPVGYYSRIAYAKAWKRLAEDILGDDPAAIGVSVAEGREAIEMIVERASRLRRAYRNLRRGRFRAFLKEIGGRPLEKHSKTRWTRPKDASAIWLEYWLGWAPLVGDIQNAMGVLTSEHLLGEFTPLKASAKIRFPSDGDITVAGCRYKWTASSGHCKVVIGCSVLVENPNKYLANRLGLLDWLGTAHAVIPFSFIVGWFNNIATVLQSFTLFSGLKVKPGSSYVQVTSVAKAGSEDQLYEDSRESGVNVTGYSIHCKRDVVTDFATPNVIWELPKALTVERAATAISLLVSIFTKG